MWGVYSDEKYKALLEDLLEAVLDFVGEHPELRETPNHDDMWNHRTDEDVCDYEDDEEEEW